MHLKPRWNTSCTKAGFANVTWTDSIAAESFPKSRRSNNFIISFYSGWFHGVKKFIEEARYLTVFGFFYSRINILLLINQIMH